MASEENTVYKFEFNPNSHQEFVDILLLTGESFLYQDKEHYKIKQYFDPLTGIDIPPDKIDEYYEKMEITVNTTPDALNPEVKIMDKEYIYIHNTTDMETWVKSGPVVKDINTDNSFIQMAKAIDKIDELFIHDAIEYNKIIGNVVKIDNTLIK